MKKHFSLFIYITLLGNIQLTAQSTFPFSMVLEPTPINGMPGLHSFAFGTQNNIWVLIGGRLDGLHARQPFNSFPQSQNNTTIYVVDPLAKQVWSRPLSELPTGIQEHLQATNMNFHQRGDELYIIGGYAYSTRANNHITFPYLTTISISGVINAIKQNQPISTYFKQVTDQEFAVTGGHLVHIKDTFLLVGGHRFDGRYNPMGNPTYTQVYTNAIKRFIITNTDSIHVTKLTPIIDEVHLHRRDYNLIPTYRKSEELSYLISSGVFQPTVDLPYLYPVDVSTTTIYPQTGFNQYLSNYHSAVANLYQLSTLTQYSIFFGGMSQYYYKNDSLIKDDNVPFTKTISAVKRTNDSLLEELKLPIEMPNLKGASAEFIMNYGIPNLEDEFINTDLLVEDTVTIGYIVGGIQSNSLNPFTNNQTTSTSASSTVYAVKLIQNKLPLGVETIKNNNSLKLNPFPNPTKDKLYLALSIPESGVIQYTWTDTQGKIIMQSDGVWVDKSVKELTIAVPSTQKQRTLMLTINLNHVYFSSKLIQIAE